MKSILLFWFISLVVAINKRDLEEQVPLYLSDLLSHGNIISVYEDYTISDNDFTIIVQKSGIRITLPDYDGSKGRMIFIKNESEDDIYVKGTLVINPNFSLRNYEPGVERIIHQSEGVMFHNDGKMWHDLHFSA